MPPTEMPKCCVCCGTHSIRAFISHAGKDRYVARQTAEAFCEAGVFPFLFEYSVDYFNPTIDNSDTITSEVKKSDLFVVVLSPAMSNAYWTQAWIGFEIGALMGADIDLKKTSQSNFFSKTIIVLQDIQQGIKATLPRVNVLFLVDFVKSWHEVSAMVAFLSVIQLMKPTVYQLGNSLRQRVMTGRAICRNESCKADFHVLMPVKDAERLEFNIHWVQKGHKALYSLECPSCDRRIPTTLELSLYV